MLGRHADRRDGAARRARGDCALELGGRVPQAPPGGDAADRETLVVSGEGGRLVSSGAATAWHDLALYLVARHAGPATANALARFGLLQWHSDGQDAFQVFDAPTDHGDAAVAAAQRWIADHLAVANPVQQMVEQSGLTARTFKRRFSAATGQTPIAYVQRARVERAKRRLERSDDPIEEISYEDPASFRRLFKRLTGLTAGEYRRRFRLPGRGRPAHARVEPLTRQLDSVAGPHADR